VRAQNIDHNRYATDWLITQDNPYTGRETYRNIQRAYAKMRRVCFAERYDAVWIVESDMLPPPDALAKLDALDAPVVTGLYVLRHGANKPNLFSYSGPAPDLGSGLDWKDLKRARAQTIRVSGGCMGCVLVRPVALGFTFEIELPRAPDVAWMTDVWKKGLVTMARLDVRCGHREVDGTILRVEDYMR
jgi:hypothetical protein